jgi:hypothetical protein
VAAVPSGPSMDSTPQYSNKRNDKRAEVIDEVNKNILLYIFLEI